MGRVMGVWKWHILLQPHHTPPMGLTQPPISGIVRVYSVSATRPPNFGPIAVAGLHTKSICDIRDGWMGWKMRDFNIWENRKCLVLMGFA